MPSFIITGTDTGVGKTYVTCGLARELRRRGIDVGVFKPFCTGSRGDVEALKDAAGVAETLDEINPCFFSAPLSPLQAAAVADISIDLAASLDAFDVLRHRHDVLLVEGVGGLMVPLRELDGRVYSFRDFCADAAGDLLIVARRTLGTLNHTWLTVNACREAGLIVRGIVFNDAAAIAESEPATTNPDILARCANIPVLGRLAYRCPGSAWAGIADILLNRHDHTP